MDYQAPYGGVKMTIKQARKEIQHWIDVGVLTVAEGHIRMNSPTLLEDFIKGKQRVKEYEVERAKEKAKIDENLSKMKAKPSHVIKVGDLVTVDPLLFTFEGVGLVTEIRTTSSDNFLYIEWTGKKPSAYGNFSDRLGTKEYYLIKKLDK